MLYCLHFYRVIFLAFVLSSLTACSSVDYYSHLINGQLSLLWQREEVSKLLESDEISETLKSRFLLSQQIRLFAENKLALPVGDAYTSYTDLGRPYVVWNVYAAPPLSFEAYTWCYPFLGCLAYRGFYDEMRAKQAGKDLESEGYEVKVGGVRAYSTLGFFDDPLLNTFIFNNEVAFVELLIHEMAHRLIYIADDTKFNENFATAVAVLGAEQWYSEQHNSQVYKAYQKYKNDYQKLISFLLGYKDQLNQVYSDKLKSEDEKLALKKIIFDQLLTDYEQFKKQYSLDGRFDKWVLSMNNASLSTLANYEELVPGFLALFERQNGDWEQFYKQVAKLAEQDKVSRHKELKRLAEN